MGGAAAAAMAALADMTSDPHLTGAVGGADALLPWGGAKMSPPGPRAGWAGIEAGTEEKTVTITL